MVDSTFFSIFQLRVVRGGLTASTKDNFLYKKPSAKKTLVVF